MRVRGTVGEMESAFHVVLNNYEVRGKVVRANDRAPFVEGSAAALVRSISGLDSGEYEHPLMARTALPAQKTGAQACTQRVWQVRPSPIRSSQPTALTAHCASQSVDPNTGITTCLGGFPKPSYQKKLPGKYRQLPDVSWLADPYTGVATLISVPGNVPEQVWQVWGGTSVAAPMFSGLWAIANQEARAPLGSAAPYMYSMPAGTIYDIVPVTSKNNVKGSILDSTGTTFYSPGAIMGGEGPGNFVSAIWDYAFLQDTALVISFGTDFSQADGFGFITQCNSATALHTKIGWDNVTGVGVPEAKAFADFFAPSDAATK